MDADAPPSYAVMNREYFRSLIRTKREAGWKNLNGGMNE